MKKRLKNIDLGIIVALVMTLFASISQAKVYTWDRFDIAFEAPDGAYEPYDPFSFFRDLNSKEYQWDEMVMTLKCYLKDDKTNQQFLENRLQRLAGGYNMYDSKIISIKVKGFKCYSLEGTMPNGSRCIISYLVSEKTTTIIEVTINYLFGNQEVAEDIIKSFSEANNKKPNDREKPKQKVQKKKDAEKEKEQLEKEKKRKNEKVYEC